MDPDVMVKERFPSFFSLALLFLIAPMLGLLVCPWVYQLLQRIAAEGSVLDAPFYRVAARVTLVAVALFLYPAYRLSGIRNPSDWGLPIVPSRTALFRRGVLLGASCMVLIYLLGMGSGVFVLDAGGRPALYFLRKTVQIIISGFAIGVFEEILFRGFIFGVLRKSIGLIPAVIAGSFFYSVVHLMRPLNPEVLNQWNSGFLLFGNLFARAASSFWQEAGTLFFAGLILSLVTHWTKTIYTAIGLHTGWVWVMMLFRLYTTNQKNMTWLFGTSDWVSKAWIGVLFSVFIFLVVLFTQKRWKMLAQEALNI